MERIRTTFKRSKTPTGADMKTQRSLEVPIQIRSASFDEIKLESSRENESRSAFLSVPQNTGRSRSFDSAGSVDSSSLLAVPRLFCRRRSGRGTAPLCVHCDLLKEWLARDRPSSLDRSLCSSSADDDGDEDDESDGNATPNILLTLPVDTNIYPVCHSPTIPAPPSFELQPPIDEPPPVHTGRRRSISRQEALFVEPTGSSLENVAASEGAADTRDSADRDDDYGSSTSGGVVGVRDIYLTVPDLKRDRAASVDSCLLNIPITKTETLNNDGNLLSVQSSNLRSRSVDIVLPTADQARYKALSMAVPQTPVTPKPISVLETRKGASTDSGDRVLRSTPDWSESAVSGEHLWSPTSMSADCCYVGDSECQRHGSRLKCSSCKIVVHSACIDVLYDRVNFTCKPTFRDVGVRQYREQTLVHHHWVHKRTEKGKCKSCGKPLQGKLSFTTKEIVALTCSWCKDSYHNKESCFHSQRIGEECSLGSQSNIIVPPSWIVKLPRKGSFKSSLRKSPKKKQSTKRKNKELEQKTFVIKPIPTSIVRPVLVFINPKSGGNQGAKLLQKFQWLLNPRQVFDLTQGGPGPGLELFRKVPNLRVLACGGDGTVGWVLSVLDTIGTRPAVGVLPLGTGNDLARALGWGGGYEDEPISKILAHIGESDTVLLDRWQLTVTPNLEAKDDDTRGKADLPLNVVNNYFSFGVDAHIALEFHEAREAHPEKFNSRIRNKLFYGTAGGKDLMLRKWKGLAELVTMECDGKDMTPLLKELKVHAIVFLNIPSYGGGTHPWNKSGGQHEPSTEDGLIEVVGLTTYQLPLLQAGSHGSCITQCRTAKIVTTKVIPMQVDGEACRLSPSTIILSRLNQATMLAKKKPGRINVQQMTQDKLMLTINLITMVDYERHYYDKELLSKSADKLGNIEVNPACDLEQVRAIIQHMLKETTTFNNMDDWWFVDSCTAERFFRIDKDQENLHYVTDIGNEAIFILDNTPITPDTETTAPVASTTSLERTLGTSISLETTIGQSVSLDISQSVDTSSAGVSLDIPEIQSSDLIDPSTSVRPIHPSPPLCTSPAPCNAYVDTSETVAKFKTVHDRLFGLNQEAFGYSNLLEKTSDSLLKAAKNNDLKMLKELHSAGYSLLSIDESGQTALHIAARYGHKDIIKYLVACAPASILNMKDNERGQTALHKAASHGRRSACCMLVAAGASLLDTDQSGMTPSQIALRANDHELASYLQTQEHFQIVSEDLETAV